MMPISLDHSEEMKVRELATAEKLIR